MKIAVVALGKIGLPLAVQFAEKGHEVIGCDVNTATVVVLLLFCVIITLLEPSVFVSLITAELATVFADVSVIS